MSAATEETYAATSKQRGGAIRGQVRSIWDGVVSECSHSHKSVTAALACAAKQLEGAAA